MYGQDTVLRRRSVRNRGYKYIIKRRQEGYWLFCVNAIWINHILKEHGIRPKDFRQLTWQDLAEVQDSAFGRRLFLEIKPRNFWQMADTLSLKYVSYDLEKGSRLYEQDWFLRYPLFAQEDVYELLRDNGLRQEDAIRIMEVVRRGQCGNDLKWREFIELYDVPEGMVEAFSRCVYLPPREKVVSDLLDIISLAIRCKARGKID